MTESTTKTAKMPVSVGLEPALIRRLDVYAGRVGRPRAWVMRLAFEQFLDREGIEDPRPGSVAPKIARGAGAATKAQRQRRSGR